MAMKVPSLKRVLVGISAIGAGTAATNMAGRKQGKKDVAKEFGSFNNKENQIIEAKAYRKGAKDAYNYFTKRAHQDGLIEPIMEKEAKMPSFGAIAKGLALTGVAAGAGKISYEDGKKRGTRKLGLKFNNFNKKENKVIAQSAYKAGARDAYEYISKRAFDETLVELGITK